MKSIKLSKKAIKILLANRKRSKAEKKVWKKRKEKITTNYTINQIAARGRMNNIGLAFY